MKRKLFFAICMLIATFAVGQNPNEGKKDETAPQFAGVKNGAQVYTNSPNEALKAYLKNTVCYPERAIECKKEGTELVQFTITAKGDITDIKFINSVCCDIDDEIVTALKNIRWSPVYENGVAVDKTLELSLAFCCTNESSKPVNVVFKEKAIDYFKIANKALFEKHNVEKAMAYYSRGINYLPNDKSLLLMRGMCRYELGDKAGANTDWERLASLGYDQIDLGTFMEQIQGLKGYNELMVKLNQ